MTGPARASKRVVLSGPLAEYAPGFAAELGRWGFLPLLSVENQFWLLARLSRWMQARGLKVGRLAEARVDEFLVERRATYTALYLRRAPRPLLQYLGGLGMLPVEEPPPSTPTDLAVAGFERYLLPNGANCRRPRQHRWREYAGSWPTTALPDAVRRRGHPVE